MPHFKTIMCNSKSQIVQILCYCGAGTLQSLIYLSSASINICRWLPSYRKIKFRFMLSTRCVPWPMQEPWFLQDPYWEAVRARCSSFPVLTNRLSFLLLKPRYRDTEEGEGWGIVCLGSRFRSKLRLNLGDSNQMTQDMLSMVGNWMGLNYTASLPTSLVSFSVMV